MSSASLYLIQAIAGTVDQVDRTERRALVRVLTAAAENGAKTHGKDLKDILEAAYREPAVDRPAACKKCLAAAKLVIDRFGKLADMPMYINGKSYKKDFAAREKGAQEVYAAIAGKVEKLP